jgi:putative transposase
MEAQKAFIIKQGEDGTPVAQICRKAGISQPKSTSEHTCP